MATNNPYPWVLHSVAAANGFGGGGAPVPPPAKPPQPVLGDVDSRLKSAYGWDFSRAPAAPATPSAPVSPLALAQSARATTSPFLRRGEFFPGSIDHAPTPPATAQTGGAAPAVADNAPARTLGNILQSPASLSGVDQGFNLATAGPGVGAAAASADPRPAIETGVTLADGRKLPYGAMVNRVPTFSDGSGSFAGHPATIPRTMTDAEIKGLGDRLQTVPAGTAPVPFLQAPSAFNSRDSEANIEAIMRSQQGGKFGITPEMRTAADLAAVTNQDARTTLGRAAMNAARRAGAATSVLQRKSALDDLAGLNTAVRANALATTQGQNTLDATNAQDANALQRTDLTGRYGLAEAGVRARLDRPSDRFQSADGSLWSMGVDGKPAPVLGPDGTQLKGAAKPNGEQWTEKDVDDAALKLLTTQPQLLGLDASGQVVDPSTGKSRPMTDADRAGVMARARAFVQQQAGVGRPQPDGTRLHGPGGKTYVVKNGVPVLEGA